jgi:redox-sensing transcriptional repressor
LDTNGNNIELSTQALRRLPMYLQYLKEQEAQGAIHISAPKVAQYFQLNEVQVRKDLSAVSRIKGKPKAGFLVSDLIREIEAFLGYKKVNETILVGVGALGQALLSYDGFQQCGIHIIAAFDTNPSLIGKEINGKPIYSVDKVSEICRRRGVKIGIITVPAKHAQIVCDQMVAGGIMAIWNFAPVHLSVPDTVILQNENMAASLAVLFKRLQDSLSKQEAL